MRIALVGSLLLALAAPAAAENWARIGSTGMGETLYIDLGSVSGAGSARTFRYKAVSSDDYSIVTLALDCAAHSFSVQRIEYHAASGGPTDCTALIQIDSVESCSTESIGVAG